MAVIGQVSIARTQCGSRRDEAMAQCQKFQRACIYGQRFYQFTITSMYYIHACINIINCLLFFNCTLWYINTVLFAILSLALQCLTIYLHFSLSACLCLPLNKFGLCWKCAFYLAVGNLHIKNRKPLETKTVSSVDTWTIIRSQAVK